MLNLLKYDLNIQIRCGYWTAYGVIAVLYILVIANLPAGIRDEVAVALIFMDTSVLGLIFVGALVLLEKQQGVIKSLSVTPLNPDSYLFAKTLSLTMLSAFVSSLIWIIPRMSFDGTIVILAGVILSSVVFTLFGLGFAAGADSFNQFLARIFLGTIIFSLSVIPVFIFQNTNWLLFLPTNAALDIFISVTKGSFSVLQILDITVLVIWILIMKLFARKQFNKHNMFL